MAQTMLNVEGINVYYGAIHAIKDISFHVDEGEIVTLIGANGAGKSTNLKTISGLLHPKTGTITYKGQNITGMRAHKIVQAGLAQVPEGRHVFLHMTVEENLEMGGSPPDGRHPVRRRAADAGHGPRPDEQRLHADAGRAFHGPVPPAGAGDLRHHPGRP